MTFHLHDNARAPDETVSHDKETYVNGSTLWMFAFWAVVFVSGLLDHVFMSGPHAQIYFLAAMLTTTVFMFGWFVTDASEMGRRPSWGLKVAVLMFGFIAIPYYLLRYKGPRRTLLSISKFSAFLLVYLVYQVTLNSIIFAGT
jgi:hypothetical protein